MNVSWDNTDNSQDMLLCCLFKHVYIPAETNAWILEHDNYKEKILKYYNEKKIQIKAGGSIFCIASFTKPFNLLYILDST